MRHTDQCRTLSHSDAAKKISDEFNMHLCAGGTDAFGKWVSFALEDGSSDHQLYDSKRDAVKHAHHNENQMIFAQIRPGGMPVCDAEVLLSVHRKMFDAGIRLTDRDHPYGGRQVIPRVSVEDQRAQLLSILTGGRTAPSNLVF